jgi:alpha/beta superfamily hydrolase
MEHLLIPGKAGNLEAILDLPDGTNRCAVMCHPHPLYGGSMSDNVISVLSAAFGSIGIGTCRFNFRGVGASAGQHGKGEGEVDDVLSVSGWLTEERSIKTLFLCGYSFGAVVVLNALPLIEVDKSILIAPPVRLMEAGDVPNHPMLVILGTEDNIVDCHSTRSFFEGATVNTISQADHFFANASAEIDSMVTEFINGA